MTTPTHQPLLRILQPGDEAALERFLLPRRDPSLFLLSNMRVAGLADHGQRLQGTYMAAVDRGEIVAVLGHFWNGNIIYQAPVCAAELTLAVRAATGRPMARLLGPADQVEQGMGALEVTPEQFDEKQPLYQLRLADLLIPAAIQVGSVRARVIVADDIDLVTDWRIAMFQELYDEQDNTETRASHRETVERNVLKGRHWVLETSNGQGPLLAMCNFNAELPEVVQVGSVFTPPGQRGRGYARAVVAGALLVARAEGVESAILFTDETNIPARTAYEALGFQHIDDYRIAIADLPALENTP